MSYRSGDMWAPKVEQIEALKAELNYFVECIQKANAVQRRVWPAASGADARSGREIPRSRGEVVYA